jgi:hypothetical protein
MRHALHLGQPHVPIATPTTYTLEEDWLPRRLRGLPTRQSSPRAGLTLGSSWEPSPPGASLVPAARATRVP